METVPITLGCGWVQEEKCDVIHGLDDGGNNGCYLLVSCLLFSLKLVA